MGDPQCKDRLSTAPGLTQWSALSMLPINTRNWPLRVLAFAPLLVLSLAASAQEVVSLALPRGATIKYLALQPGGPQGGVRPPAAAVVLLAGGNGILGLTPEGSISN